MSNFLQNLKEKVLKTVKELGQKLTKVNNEINTTRTSIATLQNSLNYKLREFSRITGAIEGYNAVITEIENDKKIMTKPKSKQKQKN